MPTLPELNGLTTDTNSVTTGYMNSHEPGGADSPKDRPPGERIDEIIRSVSDLVRRAINIERQAGKQEEWYYRLHGQLKVVEDSVRALNDCRRRMEAQQSDLSPFIRFGTSTWAYEGWQGIVYHQSYEKRRFKQECLAEYARYTYRGHPLFRTVGLTSVFMVRRPLNYLRPMPNNCPMDLRCAQRCGKRSPFLGSPITHGMEIRRDSRTRVS